MYDFKSEIELFRKLGHEFVEKKITTADFKGNSGGMGVYAQKGGDKFMIRLRIPSGILSLNSLKLVQNFTKKYKMESVHLTTRQTIQLHDLEIDQVCGIMEEALENGIYTRGGGGNFPRNVSLSPLSGADKNEAFDVTPFAILVNEHFMSKIWTYKLPRKLKVAFSNSDSDTAKCQINDLGFIATKHEGNPYFRVFVGGGLGNNPLVSTLYPELVNPEDVLYHVEAVTKLFIEHGNFENKAKARLRYIHRDLGTDEFIKLYQKYLEEAKNNLTLKEITAEKINSQKYNDKKTIEIHPINGQLKVKDMDKLIEILNKVENPEIRLSMEESMYIRNLTTEEAKEVKAISNDLISPSKIEQSVTCIGVPTCQAGIANSQKLLFDIIEYLDTKKVDKSLLPLISISGCNNSCARHQVFTMGFSGRMKKIDDKICEAFEIYTDGCVSENGAKLGTSRGTLLSEDIPKFIYDISRKLANEKIEFKEYLISNQEEFNNIIEKYKI